MRIDAHQHFWDPARNDYPWMTDLLAPIRRAFGPGDLAPELLARGIDRTILVQTRASIDETREMLATAHATPFIGGVVGWVDLTSARIANDIAALRALPGGNALVGIRHQVHDEPDPNWLLRDDVGNGLAAVGAAGLAFDLLIREREIAAAISIVTRFSNLRFVLDHIAKPPIASGELPTGWAEGIARLGQAANVSCKLSGLVTEANWGTWRVENFQPYIAHVLNSFGPRRLMFGSDWPVCLLAAPYAVVYDTLHDLLEKLIANRGDLKNMFGSTAAEAYRIDISI